MKLHAREQWGVSSHASVTYLTSVYAAGRRSLRVEKSCPILMKVGPNAKRLSLTQMAVFRCLALCLHVHFHIKAWVHPAYLADSFSLGAYHVRMLHPGSRQIQSKVLRPHSVLHLNIKKGFHTPSPFGCHATRVRPFLAVQSQPQSASQDEVPNCRSAQGRRVIIPCPVKVPHGNLRSLWTCAGADHSIRKHHSWSSVHGHCISRMM